VTARKRKEGRRVLGRRSSEAGPAWAGLRAGENRPSAWDSLRAERKRKGKRWAGGGKEREWRGERVFSFFKISFQIHFSNIQTSIKQKSMHSNHDAQTLIISKLF
jgi:hypothetical protein